MNLVCISDTHQLHRHVVMPAGDVLIHAGDFCSYGKVNEAILFFSWLTSLDYKHIVFIAGNHDKCFENTPSIRNMIPDRTAKGGRIHYLQEESVVIDDVKFWGSPWQPEFCGWAFNLPRGEPLRRKWSVMPEDTDILITHGPPKGILDTTLRDERMGCEELRRRVDVVKPKLHVFGHNHSGYGMNHWTSETDFVNASTCNNHYEPVNKAVELEFGGELTIRTRL